MNKRGKGILGLSLAAGMILCGGLIFAACDQGVNVGLNYAEHNWVAVNSYDEDENFMMCMDCGETSLPVVAINVDNKLTKEYSRGTVSVVAGDDEYNIDSVPAQVKVRGNGTATYPKLPYRIKFDKKQKMLGLNDDLKAKSWVLLEEYSDRSMLKNTSALYMARQILGEDGYYVSDCRFVEVYINDVYQGVYLLAEQQQINAGRININEVEDGYTGTDIGYLFELDSYYYNEEFTFDINYNELKFIDGQRAPLNLFVNHFTIKNDVYSEQQVAFLKKAVQNIWTIMYDSAYNDHSNLEDNPYKTLNENCDLINDKTITTAKEAVERVVDLQSLVDTFLLHEICENSDVGWSSFFFSLDMSEEGNKKLTFEAPWDFDLALGQATYNTEILYTCTNSNYLVKLANPWLVVLSGQDWFMEEAAQKWQEIRQKQVIEKTILKITTEVALYSRSFERNFLLWPSCLTFTTSQISDRYRAAHTQYDASLWLKEFILKRAKFLDSYFGI